MAACLPCEIWGSRISLPSWNSGWTYSNIYRVNPVGPSCDAVRPLIIPWGSLSSDEFRRSCSPFCQKECGRGSWTPFSVGHVPSNGLWWPWNHCIYGPSWNCPSTLPWPWDNMGIEAWDSLFPFLGTHHHKLFDTVLPAAYPLCLSTEDRLVHLCHVGYRVVPGSLHRLHHLSFEGSTGLLSRVERTVTKNA